MNKKSNEYEVYNFDGWVVSKYFDIIFFSKKQIYNILELRRIGDLYFKNIINRIKNFIISLFLFAFIEICLFLNILNFNNNYYYMTFVACLYAAFVYMFRSKQWLNYSVGDVFEGRIIFYEFAEFGSGYGTNIVYEYIDKDKNKHSNFIGFVRRKLWGEYPQKGDRVLVFVDPENPSKGSLYTPSAFRKNCVSKSRLLRYLNEPFVRR